MKIYQIIYCYSNDDEEHVDEYETYNEAHKAYLKKADGNATDYNYVVFQAVDLDDCENHEIIQYIGNLI